VCARACVWAIPGRPNTFRWPNVDLYTTSKKQCCSNVVIPSGGGEIKYCEVFNILTVIILAALRINFTG